MTTTTFDKKPSKSPAVLPIPLRNGKLSERAGDRFFRYLVLGFGGVIIALTVAMGFTMAHGSRLAWQEFGLSFLWTKSWNPVTEVFGALPFIWGTLYSSFIALLIAVPLGVGAAIFLAEMAPKRIANVITFCIELLAAIPSVILGLMGIFILVPVVQKIQPFIIDNFGWIPLFDGYPYGIGMFTAGLILALMILPYITSISRDVIHSVPRHLKEACLGLGSTHWEMVRTVILPYSRSAIIGSIFLALGRALGETMAVTMVIGNTPKISLALMDTGYTMAAVLANEFAEAVSDLYVHSLIAIGLALFFITILVNALARVMIHHMNKRMYKS